MAKTSVNFLFCFLCWSLPINAKIIDVLKLRPSSTIGVHLLDVSSFSGGVRHNRCYDEVDSIPKPFYLISLKDGKYLRNKSIIPLPLFYRTPETGWAVGAVLNTTFNFKQDNINAKPSQISITGTYTQKKQILAYIPFSIFYDNNRYYLNGEVGFYRYNYKYFGIGEQQVEPENYGVDYPKFRILAAKLISKTLYVGLRYRFENYKITSLEWGKELASGKVAGTTTSRISSLGISFLKDSRDSIFYPRKGIFAEMYILPTFKAIGADRSFNRIVLDVAYYQALAKKIVLASNFYGSFLQGNHIPFNQLSMLGGSRRMRGVFEGRFRDKNILLLQAESRFEFWQMFGLVAFSSLGYMGNEQDFIRFNKPKWAYGAGIRIKTLGKDHINLRIDYAFYAKEKGNLYLTVGEAF